MALPAPEPEPRDPRAADLRRQKKFLTVVVIAICLGAVLVLLFGKHLPWPARVLLAAIDLIVAATLWQVMRQKFSGK